jgi:hypothetical protein
MTYEVRRTRSCKPVGRHSGTYSIWDRDRPKFATMAEVRTFLAGEYGSCRQQAMYVDTTSGEPQRIGTIYCFNSPKTGYEDCAKHNQDWVEVYRIQAERIVPPWTKV